MAVKTTRPRAPVVEGWALVCADGTRHGGVFGDAPTARAALVSVEHPVDDPQVLRRLGLDPQPACGPHRLVRLAPRTGPLSAATARAVARRLVAAMFEMGHATMRDPREAETEFRGWHGQTVLLLATALRRKRGRRG